jgi:hypothetical protein
MARAGDVAGTEIPGKVSGKASGEVGVREDTGEAAEEVSEEVSGAVAEVNLGFGIAEVTHGELFGLAVLEGEEWLQRVREGYERDTYFQEVLTVLKGAPNGPGDEERLGDRRQALRNLTRRSARARQYALEDNGLITHRS